MHKEVRPPILTGSIECFTLDKKTLTRKSLDWKAENNKESGRIA